MLEADGGGRGQRRQVRGRGPVSRRSAHVASIRARTTSKRLADKIAGYGLAVGSVVAPVWPPVGGGSAMGSAEERKQFLTMVEKACRIAQPTP